MSPRTRQEFALARPFPSERIDCRRGVVLLIVMAMLALFAVVGLGFVFYADSEAEAARFRRQTETLDLSDVTPERLLSYALGQLIFDTNNPNSKMHGHSLGRSIYGAPGGTIPFSGLGRPHPDTDQTLAGLTPFDGINVPYTYPDINNPFLACLDPDNPGFLKERSFFRNGASLRPASLPLPPKDEGDVRNVDSLDGATHPTNPAVRLYNDAFWMDLDFPMLTAKDGTRFKTLFAFTVLDLDGRLNLAVSGNYQADYTKTGGTSRCGLGAFEINPARVLTLDKAEIANLFQGSATSRGRYGTDNDPDYGVRFPSTEYYARVDYSGISPDAMGRARAPYSHFPTYGGWADVATNLTSTVSAKHAIGFDYFGARSPATNAADFRLAPSNVEALLRWRERGAPALTNDLIRLLPNNLTPRGAGGAQILNLVTPYSMSFDTSHLAPFFVGDSAAKYQWNAADPYPKSTTVTQPMPQAPLASGGEYSADFRSQIAAALPRVNFNSMGGNFDLYDAVPMAKEVFDRLVRVTGALPPSSAPPFQPANPNDPQYKATRWLAQLAANIVDYLDNDNDMTVFPWNPGPQPSAADYVFGVELNDLLINEAYASADNDPAQVPGNGTRYRVNAWAEIFNSTADRTIRFGNSRYRLLLAENVDGIADSPTGLPSKLLYQNNDPLHGVTNWVGLMESGRNMVLPGDKSAGGNGFLIVGPPDASIAPARRPTWTDAGGRALVWNHPPAGMSSDFKGMPADVNALSNLKATLVLQRTAKGLFSENNRPGDKDYNPYVTVDVFPDIPVNNSVLYVGATDVKPPKLSQFRSVGRYQPMQATGVKPQSPNPAKPDNANEAQHTFGRQNARDGNVPVPGDASNTLKMPFDTVYRLDRAFISPAEALHAPAVPPWEVTQRFGTPKPLSAFKACQDDVNSLLFRFLETVTTGNPSYNAQLVPTYFVTTFNFTGMAGSGMHAVLVPGKINLNTVHDERVIQALFDRQSNSIFTDDDVHQFWVDLLNVRKTRPIAGFSDYTFRRKGNFLMLHNTLIGNLFKKMFDRAAAAGAEEYEATEGLRKVMNNITFTSNAFAVWVTAGFFEVDAAGNPVQEIGRNADRSVRHRMFAVVDRSQLVLPLPPNGQPFATLVAAIPKGAAVAPLSTTAGFLTSPDPKFKADFPWQIKAGTVLTFDRAQSTEETVVVQSVTGNQIQIAGRGFLQPHNAGAPVDLGGVQDGPFPLRDRYIRGGLTRNGVYFYDMSHIQGSQLPLNRTADGSTVPNFQFGYPGPQPQFNLREYSYVVPYYNIID